MKVELKSTEVIVEKKELWQLRKWASEYLNYLESSDDLDPIERKERIADIKELLGL